MDSHRRLLIYLFFFIPFFCISCSRNKDVDVSGIKLEVRTQRFDKAFSQLKTSQLEEGTALLKRQYGVFYDDYVSRILMAGNTADTAYFGNLRTVLNGKDYRELNHDVQQKFPLFDDVDRQLTDAFKHVRYYYPKQQIPRVISYVSGFAYQVITGDDYIGIGLDMFLGADSRFYPALVKNIPRYISKRYTPENIVPRVIEGFVRQDMYPEQAADESLLARMIYNGKIMYLMKKTMPAVPDSLIIGYSSAQDQWAREAESEVWAYFIDQNLLYETDYMKIQKFLTDAPFTPGVSEKNDSAPKLGIFTGWKIVNSYMEKHPEVTLPELMKSTDAQDFLNRSGYRPD